MKVRAGWRPRTPTTIFRHDPAVLDGRQITLDGDTAEAVRIDYAYASHCLDFAEPRARKG